jgi:sodium transport system permease protein
MVERDRRSGITLASQAPAPPARSRRACDAGHPPGTWRPPRQDPLTRRTHLGVSEALLLFAFALAALTLIGGRLQAWNLLLGLVLSEWLLILMPVLLVVRAHEVDLSLGLGLSRPRPLMLVAGLLGGASAWVLIVVLIEPLLERVLPTPPEVMRELQRLAGHHPLSLELLVIALSPAICEEALFRGALLRALVPRVGGAASVIITAVLFGLFHLSLYRFVPTTLLGLALGYTALASRSLWPAVLFHGVNNAAVVILTHLGMGEHLPPIAALIVVAFGAFAGAMLLHWREARAGNRMRADLS